MTKTLDDKFWDCVSDSPDFLSDQASGKLSSLVNQLTPEERPPWLPAAHFLLGLFHSQVFWKGGSFPLKSKLAGTPQNTLDSVILHFTTFLRASELPCLALKVGDRELALPDLSDYLWAAFSVIPGQGTGKYARHPLSINGDLDLGGIALDRLALAHFLNGEPVKAAEALESVLSHPLGQGFKVYNISRLLAWIGWLHFDGGNYAHAARPLQEAWDQIPYPKDTKQLPQASMEFERLARWYMVFGRSESESLHAFTEIGDQEDLVPSGSLNRGCDGFLLRLAISQAVVGEYAKALHATDLCVRFGVPQSDSFQSGVAFPEARLIHAALCLNAERPDFVLHDVAAAIGMNPKFESLGFVLACLCLLRFPTTQRLAHEGGDLAHIEPFVRLSLCVGRMSDEERRKLTERCFDVLSTVLDGHIVAQGFVSEAAVVLADELRALSTTAEIVPNVESLAATPAICSLGDSPAECVSFTGSTFVLKCGEQAVENLVFSMNSQTLVVIGKDAASNVWDLRRERPKCIGRLVVHDSERSSASLDAAFTERDCTLAVATGRVITGLSTTSWTQQWQLRQSGEVERIQATPDGRWLLSVVRRPEPNLSVLNIWDVERRRVIWKSECPLPMLAASLSDSAERIAVLSTGTNMGEITLSIAEVDHSRPSNVEWGMLESVEPKNPNWFPQDFALSPDGRSLWVLETQYPGPEGRLVRWQYADGVWQMASTDDLGCIGCWSLRPCGSTDVSVVVHDLDKPGQWMSLRRGSVHSDLRLKEADGAEIETLRIAPNHRAVAAGTSNGTVLLWRDDTGEYAAPLDP